MSMIADDTNAIREGLRRISQQKVIAQAEAAKRAEAESKPTEVRKPGHLFPEQGAPFRGFFVSEDGDIVPCSIERPVGIPDDGDPWDDVTLDGGSHMWGKL